MFAVQVGQKVSTTSHNTIYLLMAHVGICGLGCVVQTAKMDVPRRLRILVADDIADWRVQVTSMLQTQPEWEVIGEACDGFQAVQKTIELCPDIVLLDIGMPILNGIEAAKRIRLGAPSAKIIFVTQENDADIRITALATGAEGYVLKANARSELLGAVGAASLNGHDARAIPCD